MEDKKAQEWKKHHDYREHLWNISMNQEEYDEAIRQWQKSGLSKAEYGRQALKNAHVISRLNAEDLAKATDMMRMHSEVNEMLKILNTLLKNHNIPEGNKEEKLDFSKEQSVVKYLYKVREKLDEIESNTCDIANYFSSKFGW